MITISADAAAWIIVVFFGLCMLYAWLTRNQPKLGDLPPLTKPQTVTIDELEISLADAEQVRRMACKLVGQALFLWSSPHLHLNGGGMTETATKDRISFRKHWSYSILPHTNSSGAYIGRFDEYASFFAGLLVEKLLYGTIAPITTRLHIEGVKEQLVGILGEGTPGPRPSLPKWWRVPALTLHPSPLPREAFGTGNAAQHGPWLANCANLHARTIVMRYQSQLAKLVDQLVKDGRIDPVLLKKTCGSQHSTTSSSAS